LIPPEPAIVTQSPAAPPSYDSLIVELLHADAQPPQRATSGSAGYDLRAYLVGRSVKCSDGNRVWDAPAAERQDAASFSLAGGITALIPLGFKARLPIGIEAQIRPRSGTSFKKGLQIPNAPGTIDSDYPDEWMVIVRNPLSHAIVIEHGERIAQMVLGRYETLAVESGSVGVTTDRVGGFGSTGR
jgi:dUTP pyrophosphatase